jgi:predicted ATPase
MHNRELDFGEGITVIFGENESGKSTLHTFIQGIFFGIRRCGEGQHEMTCTAVLNPGENSSYYAGHPFPAGGKPFGLTRNFSKESQRG